METLARMAGQMRVIVFVLSAYTLAVCYDAWTELGTSAALVMAPIAILAVLALRASFRHKV